MASRWFKSLLLLLCALCARSLDTAYTLTTDGPQSLVEGARIFEEGDYERAALYFWRAVLFQEQNKDKYTVEDAYGKFMQCFAVQDRIADGFVFIARESLQRGQKPMALQYVQQALQMEPTNEEAQSILAKIEGREDPIPKRTTSKSDNKFQPRFGTAEAENPLEGKSATDLYEYGSTMFSRKNYEYCADAFELSCLRSEFELGPSCSNAVYCRMLLTDWGFNGTQFDKDIERLESLTIKEIAMNRDGSGDEASWRRACSVHPHMMLGYPMDPKLKKLVTESVAALDEMMARVDGHGGIIPLPDGMPFEHKSRRNTYIEEASAPGFKLKVGFVSSGFNSKAVLMLSQDIFRFYDRSKIEMHIFSLGPEDNPNFIKIGMGGVDWRKRVAGHVDYFHDIANIKDSHVEMAKYIHERGIHILIEWDGFARQGERAQGLMGLHPAPIQILHQEYLGTSGAKYVDYLFSDKIVSPPSLVDDLYTEKIIYMPNHFFSKGHAVQKEVTPPRHDYLPRKVPYELGYGSPQENRCMASGIKQPSFVFCNFNKFLKNNPETVRSWIKILREVPGSIICLLENPATGVPYLKRFIHEATGEPTTFKNPLTGEEEPDFIPGDGEDIVNRIHFLPWERSPFVHQQRNQDFCNVMLDSHPYNGHTVAQDALYAGVPIVTRSDGDDMSSRVSTSANIVLGIEELNAYGGSAEYAEIAIDIATNETKFRDIRGRLVDTALQRNPMHPYWDAPRYTKNLENGWFQAWDRFLSGLPPEHITIVEDAETARGSFNDILERFPSDPVPKDHDELLSSAHVRSISLIRTYKPRQEHNVINTRDHFEATPD
eukprot:Nitzschia sp. Nitz4//scaffold46_size129759//34//2598//NITZ4_003478-RA/size129759-snap-gene-0.0-mRNA-1//1//CDS//3329552526//5697//frame0